MPDQLQLRGGTTTEHNSFTGAAREVTVDTTKKTLVVHDGSQAGGTPLMKESGATAASSVQIGTGGVERLKLTSSEVVFNETSTDTDFRIEGNGEANLFKVDAGNDRIGIGTASPARKVHLHESTSGNNFISFTNSTTGSTSGDGILVGMDSDESLLISNKENNHVAFATNNTERMRLDSSGKVGIGTTSPAQELHVKGVGTVAEFEGSGGGGFIALKDQDDGTIGFVGVDGGKLKFQTSGSSYSDKLVIDTAGNTGIGTTSPTQPLHVQSTTNPAILARNDSGGTGIRMQTDSGSANSLSFSDLDAHNQGLILYHHADNRMQFNTNGGEAMRIDSSGRVMIGTTAMLHSQSHKFNVAANDSSASISINRYANSAFAGYLFFRKSRNSTIGGNTIVQNNDLLGRIYFEGNDGSSSVSAAYIEGLVDGTPGNQDMPGRLVFLTTPDSSPTPVERMRIDSQGRVMIGTTNADSVGSVNKHLVVGSTSNNDEVALTLNVMEGTHNRRCKFFLDDDDGVFGVDSTASTGVAPFVVRMGGTERVRVSTDGHLNVNTTGAGSVFNVKDTITGVQPVDDTQTITLQTGATSGAANTGTGIMFLNHNGSSGSGGGTFGGTISCLKENATVGNTANYLRFATRAAGGSITESMRIDSVGGLRLNATGVNADNELFSITEAGTAHNIGGFRINNASNDKILINMIHVANSGDRKFFSFKRTGSVTEIGSINTTTSATAFNTSSDYRLKENQVLISDGITRLKTLKPYRFNFKIEPDKTVDGFFAHEVSSAVPEAITGVKDAVETTYYTNGDTIPDGKAVGDVKEENVILPQSLDYSKFTPLLTAALQEVIAKIEVLETKVAALEAA